ncbi:MAG: hypothetical protein HC816_19850 [Leptolyngbyaceae cyanobacterium RM1_1_2]|nr:hypothetical protein [Leptolyngbyaceae cyanobacterium RM1_1_2]
MLRRFSLRWFWLFIGSLGLFVSSWMLQFLLVSAPAANVPKLEVAPISALSLPALRPLDNLLQAALNSAEQAKATAQTAQTTQDWSVVMGQWADALTLIQSVPGSSPQRLFAQRKGVEFCIIWRQRSKRPQAACQPFSRP